MTLAVVCEKCIGLGSVAKRPRPEQAASSANPAKWQTCPACHGTGERPR